MLSTKEVCKSLRHLHNSSHHTKAEDCRLGSLPSLGPIELRCPLYKGFAVECTVKLFYINFSFKGEQGSPGPSGANGIMVSLYSINFGHWIR